MTSEFLPVLPEMVLLAAVFVVLLVDLFAPPKGRGDLTYVVAQASLAVTIVAALMVRPETSQVVLAGSFVADPMSFLLKIAVLVLSLFAFAYARPYVETRGLMRGEFYVLGLFGVLGMMVMISGASLLTLYLGLELLSLCQYALVALNRDNNRASEAAMKYFVLGSLASGMLLYGVSLLYGLTGSLQLTEVHQALASQGVDELGALVGLVFVVVGMSFKLGAVPFHAWIPDVYEGAPTPIALYIGAAPKVAAFALFARMLADGLITLQGDAQVLLSVLAVLSLGIGNVVAIAQTNLKRMLGYSTISHVGFILLGILAGTDQGYAAAMFYVIWYALMSAGAFGMIILLSRKGFEAENLDDFKGLHQRSPWFALMMLFIMFAMAGVPPFAGFYAKLSVLRAVVEVDMVWLAIVAVLFSVIGAFYYLRVVKLMYFDEPTDSGAFQEGLGLRVALSANGLSALLLGFYPAALMAWCVAAASL
jgi:NADH-quinone oxidoreductase subunit N